jgi:hypothetical protein
MRSLGVISRGEPEPFQLESHGSKHFVERRPHKSADKCVMSL